MIHVNGDFSHSYIIEYEYFSLMSKMQKILENPKMSFNGQSNMFIGKIISCTCHIHVKLNILNPFNICFYQMVF